MYGFEDLRIRGHKLEGMHISPFPLARLYHSRCNIHSQYRSVGEFLSESGGQESGAASNVQKPGFGRHLWNHPAQGIGNGLVRDGPLVIRNRSPGKVSGQTLCAGRNRHLKHHLNFPGNHVRMEDRYGVRRPGQGHNIRSRKPRGQFFTL